MQTENLFKMNRADVELYLDQAIARVSDSDANYIKSHKTRFLETLELVFQSAHLGWEICEMGGSCIFTWALRKFLPGHRVTNTISDLRYPLPYLADNRFDLIVSGEVLEHLKDQDPPPLKFDGNSQEEELQVALFNNSGVLCNIRECYRILKHGGAMILTTPNGASLLAANCALHGEPPMMYRPHVREFTYGELSAFFSTAGFIVETFYTKDVWNIMPPEHARRCGQ